MSIRVMVADDHTLIREGLARWLTQAGMTVVAEARDGQEAVDKAKEVKPDVVLMDLSLPVMSGIAATKAITSALSDTKVLVLTMLSDDVAVDSARSAGASGFIVKDSTTTQIVDAVSKVASGEKVFTVPGEDDPPPIHARHLGPEPVITKREEEVLRLMATGVSISEAAKQLYISVKTVKNHLASIYLKLDTHDRAQAVLKAVRMGLIDLH
ncbi:MAG TPA: response regulator transcription factor [Acidimicrobiales bacterium]|nr:response regulator transcription factor [Acidimicrobiales bacterium]